MSKLIDSITDHKVCIGRCIKKLRREKGISGGKLGKILGVQAQSVYAWESGASSINAIMLYVISVVFDYPIDYFFSSLPEDTNLVIASASDGED